MIKSQLIAKMVDQFTHIPEHKIVDGVNSMIDAMAQALADNQRIEIRGFGSFSLHHRQPRNAHNPKTGEKVVTEAKYTPHFKPGKELRERVNASRIHVPLKDKD